MPQNLAQVVNTISKRIIPAAPAIVKAKAIYDWMIDNISYDDERKKSIEDHIEDPTPYKPETTLELRKGICTDLSILYMAIAQKMGIKAYFGDVKIDCHGKNVCHACAIVDVQTRIIQVDVAYRRFDAGHKACKICNPPIIIEDETIMPKRKILRYIFAAGALISGLMSYFSSESSTRFKHEEISLLESSTGSKFISQNGIINLHYDKKTEQQLKEYIFFLEAKKGILNDKEILEKYLETDQNKDCTISLDEALQARISARNAYFNKKN